jgi:transcriptional regulator with XRE-family HTH domain
MPKRSPTLAELKNLGRWLLKARTRQGLTQKELAVRAGVSQPRISDIEKGEVLPTLPQLIRLAKALVVPVQWFLSGCVVPGREMPDFALQLQWLGVVDLLVPDAVVPGAFVPTEQVLALAVAGNEPNPRIIEAIPAVLAWNRWSPSLLRAYSRPRTSRTSIRLAWLADVALTIHRTRATGFPGGCPQRKNLESFIGPLSKAKLKLTNDDLGRPGKESALPPVSKRWMISYDAPLSAFDERAKHLISQLQHRRLSRDIPTQRSDE